MYSHTTHKALSLFNAELPIKKPNRCTGQGFTVPEAKE
jgi:hypothetical protein